MFYEQDWILRQISVVIKFIRSLLSKEINAYEQDEDFYITRIGLIIV